MSSHPRTTTARSSSALLAAAAAFSLLLTPTTAATTSDNSTTGTSTLQVYTDTPGWSYQGCYNDTSALPGTTGEHALPDAIWALSQPSSLPDPNGMTVPKCLTHCDEAGRASDIGRPYAYAGLQYSRECYCGEEISPLAAEFGTSDTNGVNSSAMCDTACDGDLGYACGGSGTMSIYKLVDEKDAEGSGTALLTAARDGMVVGQGRKGGAVLALVVGLGVWMVA